MGLEVSAKFVHIQKGVMVSKNAIHAKIEKNQMNFIQARDDASHVTTLGNEIVKYQILEILVGSKNA